MTAWTFGPLAARRGALLLTGVIIALAAAAYWRSTAALDSAHTAVVRRGTLSPRLTSTGVVKPLQSITYRSPLGGRDAEITFLVSEGTRVGEGDLLIRLDTTDLQREAARAAQDFRQAQVDLKVAEIDRQEGQSALESLSEGEGALGVEEARTRLELAEKRVDRLRAESDSLTPLLDRGFITKEELRRTADELEQAEEDLALARRRAEVFIERTHPRDRQRAELQLAQKEAQLLNVRMRVTEAEANVRRLVEQVEQSSIHARRPGLVVYEEYLSGSPRRKIRTGDRVTASQGLVTIPEISRMVVEATVSEAEVHRLQPGQQAEIGLEAFPAARLTGRVTRIGTLARSSAERPFEDKRFDLVVELDPSDVDLRPEMTARVDVQLGDRADVLLVPLNAVFERDGAMVCHVMTLGGVETKQVQIGESSDTAVEIVAGLSEGDRVALTDAGGPGPGTPAEGRTAPALRPFSSPGGGPLGPG